MGAVAFARILAEQSMLAEQKGIKAMMLRCPGRSEIAKKAIEAGLHAERGKQTILNFCETFGRELAETLAEAYLAAHLYLMT